MLGKILVIVNLLHIQNPFQNLFHVQKHIQIQNKYNTVHIQKHFNNNTNYNCNIICTIVKYSFTLQYYKYIKLNYKKISCIEK